MDDNNSVSSKDQTEDEVEMDLSVKIINLRSKLNRDINYTECWRKISEDLNIPLDKCKNHLTKLLTQYKYHSDNLHPNIVELLNTSDIDWDFEFCLENFSSLCRFCCRLQSKDLKFLEIFNDDSEDNAQASYDLIEMIHFTLYDNQTLTKFDCKLSNLMCETCNKSIKDFNAFKKICDKNAELLMQVKGELDKSQSPSKINMEIEAEEVNSFVESIENLKNEDRGSEDVQSPCESSNEEEDDDECSELSISNDSLSKDQEDKPPIVRKKKNKSFEDKLSRKSYRGKNSQCPICGKLVKGIQMHLLIHTGEKKHNCSYCSKSFTQSGQLKRHINSHLNIRNYKCPEPSCDRTFVDPSSVTKHLVVHNKDDRKFQCSLCGSRFNRLGALRYHEKTHRQERSHVCDICKKSFLAKYDLTKHYRSHTGEKPYSCKYCDKKFSISKNAKVHLRVHTKEKPYSCKYCDLSFAYRSSMKNHLIKIHNHADVSNLTLLRSGEDHLQPQLTIENLEIETIAIDPTNYQVIPHSAGT